VREAEPIQLALGQMESIHRDHDVGVWALGGESGGQRRLARPRSTDDADHPAVADTAGCHRTILPHGPSSGLVQLQSCAMSSIYELEMASITGDQVSFDQFRDQVLLIVNVASA
jgi:hypothetical protein